MSMSPEFCKKRALRGIRAQVAGENSASVVEVLHDLRIQEVSGYIQGET